MAARSGPLPLGTWRARVGVVGLVVVVAVAAVALVLRSGAGSPHGPVTVPLGWFYRPPPPGTS